MGGGPLLVAGPARGDLGLLLPGGLSGKHAD